MLLAILMTARGEKDARHKHENENGNNKEWGCDVHARYQRPHARVT